MNERIKELADEAAKFSAIMALPAGKTGDELFVGKFAELIIKECMDVGVKSGILDNDWNYPRYSKAIKEHFGMNNEHRGANSDH